MRGVVVGLFLGLGVQQQFDQYLQQQWMYYYQNRQPPPKFSRPPICQSTLLGGPVITTCY